MKIVLAHPTSNEFNRATAKGLVEKKLLSEFHTTISHFPGDLLNLIGRFRPFSEINRRRQDLALKPYTHNRSWLELGRLASLKVGLHELVRHETGIFSVDAIYRDLDKKVASRLKTSKSRGASGVYAYEDGAYFSFREAKHLDMMCFYDLPIGYWRASHRLLKIEQKKWPEWAPSLIGLTDSQNKLFCKDEELKNADAIFVASSFTAHTLNEFPGQLAPIHVIPYGFPKVNGKRKYTPLGKGPLKVLFVGGISQRKGLADLISAVDSLKKSVELTIIGRKIAPNCAAINHALSKHRWIPSLPHEDILKMMKAHDVLVFPSLFEGFGLVITEAMSQGTPVITTDRTAGPDLIESGENGWIIKAGSIELLKNALENLLYNPDWIIKNGLNAQETARKRPWEKYGQEMAEAVIHSFSENEKSL